VHRVACRRRRSLGVLPSSLYVAIGSMAPPPTPLFQNACLAHPWRRAGQAARRGCGFVEADVSSGGPQRRGRRKSFVRRSCSSVYPSRPRHSCRGRAHRRNAPAQRMAVPRMRRRLSRWQPAAHWIERRAHLFGHVFGSQGGTIPTAKDGAVADNELAGSRSRAGPLPLSSSPHRTRRRARA